MSKAFNFAGNLFCTVFFIALTIAIVIGSIYGTVWLFLKLNGERKEQKKAKKRLGSLLFDFYTFCDMSNGKESAIEELTRLRSEELSYLMKKANFDNEIYFFSNENRALKERLSRYEGKTCGDNLTQTPTDVEVAE